MEGRDAQRRLRRLIAATAATGCLLAPAASSGHSDDMTLGEIAGTVAQAGGAPPPEMLVAPDATLDQAAPASAQDWYLGKPVAARLGSSAESRYTLAGGCFALEPAGDDAGFVAQTKDGYAADVPENDGEVFRFQPTGLGTYLLLGSNGRFPTPEGESLAPGEGPSRSAEWTVEGDPAAGYELTSKSGEAMGVSRAGELTLAGADERFTLRAAGACASFPEIEVNATGAPYTAKPNFGQAKGTIDLHSHIMAFEGFGRGLHCGRPWHPLGVESALVDCPDHAPNGTGALAANLLVFQDPLHQHHPDGWPSFQGWPTKDWVFTHEQTYYKWIERYWRGGLRLLTLLAVDNSAACQVNVHKTESCNEMDAVRRQIQAVKDLQAYIDAQWGGPGKGFLRIVRNPFQARKVINRGKLAVVLGIEVSEPLDCGLRNGVSQCDEAKVDAGLEEMHDAGVRQMEIVNKFDNAFAGVAMDGGFQGPVINGANKITTGEFWDVETCTGTDEDRTQITSIPSATAALLALLPGGVLQLPVYPDPPHCNVRGLSDLGDYLIREMAKRKMIFDPDHLSVYARDESLDLVDELDYSGIVSSHSWADRTSYRRIMELGGVVTPMAGHAPDLDEEWANQRELYEEGEGSEKYGFGFGFGDDMNGFGGPRNPTGGTDAEISYPFNSPIDKGVTFERQQSGTRTYDLNTDGIAHFGQWPDYTEAVRQDSGKTVIKDLKRGAESYLRMWERAVGIRGPHQKGKHGHLTAQGAKKMKLGMRPKRLLRSAGQPEKRKRGWRWAVRRSGGSKIGAAFKGNNVAMIATNARGYRAAGVRPGDSASRLPNGADNLGDGVWVSDAAGNRRFAFGVRGGKVGFVAVGTGDVTGSAAAAVRMARTALRGR